MLRLLGLRMRGYSVRKVCVAFLASAAAACLAGCAGIPSIPDDYQFPLEEIARYAACELRDAYRELSRKEYAPFKASEYAIAVQLQPKADTEFTARAGLTGKSSTTAPRFTSWALAVC